MASELQQMKVVKATYDFSVDGGAAGAIGLRKFIPDNAIIVSGFIDVITTCTTENTDAGLMAIKVQGANDIVTAIAVVTSGDVWDAGLHGVLPGAYAERTVAGDTAVLDKASKSASYVKTSAVREITATISGEDFTAGKFDVFLYYFITE